jgi:hypothetical protein
MGMYSEGEGDVNKDEIADRRENQRFVMMRSAS